MSKPLLEIVKSFSAILVYSFMVNVFNASVKKALIISMFVMTIVCAQSLKRKYIITWVIFANFILMLTVAIYLPNTFFERDPWVISSFTLAVIAWASLLLKKPFTIQYAKDEISSEKWHHPLFYKINKIISACWAGVFSATFIMHVMILQGVYDSCILKTTIYLLTITGVLFSMFYPKVARKVHTFNNEVITNEI